MFPEIIQEEKEILQAPHAYPSVSVIVPFEPKMSSRKDLEYRLDRMLEQVKQQMNGSSMQEQTVMERLEGLVRHLNYNTHKKTIALFASPLLEKVYYLDILVEEKIIVDNTFEIRDLVFSKKDIHKYLVLVLSNKHSKIFIGNTTEFIRIVSNTPQGTGAAPRDLPEQVSNFSTVQDLRETVLDKFLHHVDSSLGIILNAYDFPLFILGPEKVIGHFIKLSHHHKRITGLVNGNFDEATEAEIREAIQPQVADWKKVKQTDLLHHLEEAGSHHKLAKGMRDVWKIASEKRGRLLIVEKNFICPARYKSESDIEPDNETNTGQPFIRDAVDDVIEKVLSSGGDVEFVDPGVLDGYEHIALIRHF
ncbi:hypothetical protein [Pseudoflavitalea rhizosphaerae]|uniref:baeRF3 domain-containing protein n=1 Tax=Pseudoflavitalea rhizosphaerae TaxID=1884793 RepID=UPI000F8D6DCA|nr:hypothetical protein [Pseudoflavitalea rhizosphaerae]